ncbi:MAG: DEAD/DEAH box helicase [Candidatus Magnetomorum sp.]|nr:DEAD/DEAH box helicase [Candidatus Magnetomorum sp.]
MGLFNKLKIIKKQAKNLHFEQTIHSNGIEFFLPSHLWDRVIQKQGNSHLLHQFVALQMLLEEGLAEQRENGFFILSESAVLLDEHTRYLLDLPAPWPGGMTTEISGHTQSSQFNALLFLKALDGEIIRYYDMNGPMLELSEEEKFLPDALQWHALKAIHDHQTVSENDRTEYHHLSLIYQLQQAQKKGLNIHLAQFSQLDIVQPERISVTIDEQDDGSAVLTPVFGNIAQPDDISKRLGQLDPNHSVQSMRINDTIVLLNEEKLSTIHEIIHNRTIPKSHVRQFMETPAAYIDASRIDLDVGFSFRVKGATRFKHGYFGDTDLSEINWFNRDEDDVHADPDMPSDTPLDLTQIISDQSELERFRNHMTDSLQAGANCFEFNKQNIPLDQIQIIEAELDALALTLEKQSEEDGLQNLKVIDISQNDDFCEFGNEVIPPQPEACFYTEELDFSGYKRQPYPHQLEGIRWILGLSVESINAPQELQDRLGALLADDMGLGKTFMALIAASEYYRLAAIQGDIQRPILVVAPLSLLENWKNEVAETFEKSPFRDIVILQSSAELQKYRIHGAGVETRQGFSSEEDSDDAVCDTSVLYSLKIGPEFGTERLDMTCRMVLTTYQTLRDYQFSLCRIDWSLVIFDEAQNIKNPNALQTRTAKGLKARFKLVVTGTPVENHLGDFWCLFDTARPGVLGAYQQFLKTFVLPMLRSNPEELPDIRNEIGSELRNIVGGLMLRRTKAEKLTGLPVKRILVGAKVPDGRLEIFDPNLVCMMEGYQLEMYEAIVNTTVSSMDCPNVSGQVLRGLQQLKEVCLHPDLIDGGTPAIPETPEAARAVMIQSAKLECLLMLLTHIQARDEKAIIFILNKRLQQFIILCLQLIFDIQVNVINGDTKAVAKNEHSMTRVRIIQAFQAKEGFQVLVMSPVAAGVGLTVTGANNVIHLERHWNPAKEDQATDRAYRIGQKKDVNVYIPIVHHPEERSFELNLHALLSNKIDLKEAIVTQEDVTAKEIAKTGLFNQRLSSKKGSQLLSDDIARMPRSHFIALIAELMYQKTGNKTSIGDDTIHPGCHVLIENDSEQSCIIVHCFLTRHSHCDQTACLKMIEQARDGVQNYQQSMASEMWLFTNARKFSKEIIRMAKDRQIFLKTIGDVEKMLEQFPVSREAVLNRTTATP